MKIVDIAALLSIVVLSSFSYAETIERNKIVVSLDTANEKDIGDFHKGKLGRVAVHFDKSEESSNYDIAIIEMDNLPDRKNKVKFTRITLYKDQCKGKSFGVFEYNPFSYGQQILPQTFSLTSGSCVKIDFFDHVNNQKLVLVDGFEISVVE